MVKALIDGDVVCYACGFAAQKTVHDVWTGQEWMEFDRVPYWADEVNTYVKAEPLSHCLHTVKQMLHRILRAVEAEDYAIFLTGRANFRLDIDPEYKANRKDAPKPIYLQDIRDYLTKNWQALVVDYMEADDALGLMQADDTVICTIDKDLDLVPGKHYNWKREEMYEVSDEEASRKFYTQLLMGDRVDNIKGVPGIGIKKAEKILADCECAAEMHDRVLGIYLEKFEEDGKKEFIKNARLLWIRQRDQEEPPINPDGEEKTG